MPFYICTGKLVEFNREKNRYEKYTFEEITAAGSLEIAQDHCLHRWASDPDTQRKVLRPRAVVKTMKVYEGDPSPCIRKVFLEVVNEKGCSRSVTTRLNDRPFRR